MLLDAYAHLSSTAPQPRSVQAAQPQPGGNFCLRPRRRAVVDLLYRHATAKI
jgi:hypothetical protein